MVAQITSEFARRRDTAFARARELVRRDPEGFAEAGRRLGEWFPAKRDHGPEQEVEFLLSDRIERAARAASVDDHFFLPPGRSFSFVRNEPGHDRALAARMTILALLLGGDPRANEVVTPDICELAVLPWDSEWGAEPGRHMVGWRTHDWPHNDEPSLGVLQRLEEAVIMVSAEVGQADRDQIDSPSAIKPDPSVFDVPAAVERTMEPRTTADDHQANFRNRIVPVPKPAGWTRAELIAQANYDDDNDGDDDGHKGMTLSASTFDTIRASASIPAATKGGGGAQRRFSVADLRRLIDAVERGNFRKKEKIAKAWRLLLPKDDSE